MRERERGESRGRIEEKMNRRRNKRKQDTENINKVYLSASGGRKKKRGQLLGSLLRSQDLSEKIRYAATIPQSNPVYERHVQYRHAVMQYVAKQRLKREQMQRDREREVFGENLDLSDENEEKIKMITKLTQSYFTKRLLPTEELALSKACDELYNWPAGTAAKHILLRLKMGVGRRQINLSRIDFDREKWQYLLGACIKLGGHNLVSIDMSHTNLAYPRFLPLAEALVSHERLNHLDLSGNFLGRPRSSSYRSPLTYVYVRTR